MEEKGFFGKLFDFSFEEFVTPTIIKVVYAIILVVIGIVSLVALIAALSSGEAGSIITAIVVVPVLALLYLILARIWMEVVVVIFRIAGPVQDSSETLLRIEQLLARQGGSPPAPPSPGDS